MTICSKNHHRSITLLVVHEYLQQMTAFSQKSITVVRELGRIVPRKWSDTVPEPHHLALPTVPQTSRVPDQYE
jgi:hypothetical protein